MTFWGLVAKYPEFFGTMTVGVFVVWAVWVGSKVGVNRRKRKGLKPHE